MEPIHDVCPISEQPFKEFEQEGAVAVYECECAYDQITGEALRWARNNDCNFSQVLKLLRS